ncbi:MAG: DUF4410 domain-containing protein [Desulfobacterales bacterium]|jgi:hypothetical protein|nr:DUF4410 domain-containing protein [Desulfobacterales bacterium]
MKRWMLLSLVVLGLLVTGCASSVQRRAESEGYRYGGEKFSRVDLSVDPAAAKDPDDLVRFENQKLQGIIERSLEANGLLNAASPATVKVEITDLRLRSTFNAFMWGFMAGDDHIVGDVALVAENGAVRHTFKVAASYALGGFAGMNETRMGWLYEEFAKLTAAEIKGGPSTGK